MHSADKPNYKNDVVFSEDYVYNVKTLYGNVTFTLYKQYKYLGLFHVNITLRIKTTYYVCCFQKNGKKNNLELLNLGVKM